MELYNSIKIYKFAVRIIPMKPNMLSFETLRRYEDPKTGRETAFDIHRFYFIPSERISVRP